jgi:Zn ribbon nucleic-acid-binding protein
MKTLENGEKCPKCEQPAMPRWKLDGRERARCCQACGHIEERVRANSS